MCNGSQSFGGQSQFQMPRASASMYQPWMQQGQQQPWGQQQNFMAMQGQPSQQNSAGQQTYAPRGNFRSLADDAQGYSQNYAQNGQGGFGQGVQQSTTSPDTSGFSFTNPPPFMRQAEQPYSGPPLPPMDMARYREGPYSGPPMPFMNASQFSEPQGGMRGFAPPFPAGAFGGGQRTPYNPPPPIDPWTMYGYTGP